MKLKAKHRFPSSVLLWSFFGPSSVLLWVLLWVPGPVFFSVPGPAPLFNQAVQIRNPALLFVPSFHPLWFSVWHRQRSALLGTPSALVPGLPLSHCRAPLLFLGRRNGGGEKRTTRKKIRVKSSRFKSRSSQVPRDEVLEQVTAHRRARFRGLCVGDRGRVA